MNPEHEAKVRTIIEAAIPDSEHRRHIMTKVLCVPNQDNALALAEWTAELPTAPDGRTGLKRDRRVQTSTIVNRVQAVGSYLVAAGERELESLDDVFFNEYFTDRTTPNPEQPRQTLSNQVAYEHQRFVLYFLQSRFGADEGLRRAPIMSSNLAWGSNRPLGCSWEDIAKMRGLTDLEGKAQLDLLSGTGVHSQDLRAIRMEAVFFEGGRALLRVPPTRNWPDERIVPIHHEAKTMGAFVRHVKANEPERQFLFPDPLDSTKPMSRAHLAYKVKFWSKKAVVRGVNTRTMQEAYLLYLAGRAVPDQFLSHIMGVGSMNRVYYMRDYADRAKKAGRPIGGPARQAGPDAGLVACVGCGNPNNAAGDQYCPVCGTELTEDVLSEANAIRAKIMRDVADLLEVNGQSLEQRIRAAIAAVEKVN